jgi:hypothetical protein
MRQQNVEICEGPGCKAWSSDRIACEFSGVLDNQIHVCRVPCMNACGGGVSVRINSNQKVVKLKEVNDFMNVFSIQEETLAVT